MGAPEGEIWGWKIGVRNRMYGGASGKSGGKTNSASNIPPSHTVSDGPKIVAVHTHVLSSAGPIDAEAGISCLIRSTCWWR